MKGMAFDIPRFSIRLMHPHTHIPTHAMHGNLYRHPETPARRITPPLAALLLGAILLAAVPLHGSFFMRLRGSDSRQLLALGGRTVYRCKATVNGRSAELSVLGFDFPLHEVADEVRRLWRLPAVPRHMGAWIERSRNGRQSHLLLLPGADGGSSTAWLIEQREGAARAAGERAPPPPGANPCPGAEVRCWVLNERTRSLLVIGETRDSPADAQAAATSTLAAEGWTPMLPAAAGGLALLARDGRAALIFATRRAGESLTRVAVLRQGAVAR